MNKTELKELILKRLLDYFKEYNPKGFNNKESIVFDSASDRITLGYPVKDYRPEYQLGFVVCKHVSQIEEIANKFFLNESDYKKLIKNSVTICQNIGGGDFKSGKYEYYKVFSEEDINELLNKILPTLQVEVINFLKVYENTKGVEEKLNYSFLNKTDELVGAAYVFKGLVAAKITNKEYFEDLVLFYRSKCIETPNFYYGLYPDKFNGLVEHLRSY